MARAGRKRKQGKRTTSGRLSRAGEQRYDKGSDAAQARQSQFGEDGYDPIGRAYRAGLLGEDGLELRNLSRKVFRAYWPMLAVGIEKSCLGLDIHGQAANDDLLDPDARQYKIDREKKLTETLRQLDRMGRQHRKAFDDLCIEILPDFGPSWLDGLIWAKGHNKPADPAHLTSLKLAIEAMERIAHKWG